jgi:hypothetical protein
MKFMGGHEQTEEFLRLFLNRRQQTRMIRDMRVVVYE